MENVSVPAPLAVGTTVAGLPSPRVVNIVFKAV